MLLETSVDTHVLTHTWKRGHKPIPLRFPLLLGPVRALSISGGEYDTQPSCPLVTWKSFTKSHVQWAVKLKLGFRLPYPKKYEICTQDVEQKRGNGSTSGSCPFQSCFSGWRYQGWGESDKGIWSLLAWLAMALKGWETLSGRKEMHPGAHLKHNGKMMKDRA